MLLLQNSPRNQGCFASSCAAPTTALSPDVFAQVDKHTADILLTGNSPATPGNKFRYCWQAKLNVELATTSLPLFSIQQHGGQIVLPPSFGRFYVLLSVYLTFSEWWTFFSEALTAAVSYVPTIFPSPHPKPLLQFTQNIPNIDSILQKITSPSRVVLFFCESVIMQELF